VLYTVTVHFENGSRRYIENIDAHSREMAAYYVGIIVDDPEIKNIDVVLKNYVVEP